MNKALILNLSRIIKFYATGKDRDFEDEDVKKRFPNVSLKYIL